jgi:hypothetical protein
MVNKVPLRQIFSKYFGFSCQFSFHQLLHTHLSSGTSTTGQLVGDLTNWLCLIPPYVKLKKKLPVTNSRTLSFKSVEVRESRGARILTSSKARFVSKGRKDGRKCRTKERKERNDIATAEIKELFLNQVLLQYFLPHFKLYLPLNRVRPLIIACTCQNLSSSLKACLFLALLMSL